MRRRPSVADVVVQPVVRSRTGTGDGAVLRSTSLPEVTGSDHLGGARWMALAARRLATTGVPGAPARVSHAVEAGAGVDDGEEQGAGGRRSGIPALPARSRCGTRPA